MKYCSKCKRLVFNDEKRCDCGGKLTEKLDFSKPAYLAAVSDVNKDIVCAELERNGIPYSVDKVSKVTPVYGVEDGQYIFYVPVSFIKKGIDALTGISAMEQPDYYGKLELPENPEWEEMSPLKRRLVQVFSVVGFIVVVWLCVAGVDFVANLFVNLVR